MDLAALTNYISTKNTLAVKRSWPRTKKTEAWIKRSEIKMGGQGLCTADGNKI